MAEGLAIELLSWKPIGVWTFAIEQLDCTLCKNKLTQLCIYCCDGSSKNNDGCKVVKGECGHGFHRHCMDSWIKSNSQICPTDRFIWKQEIPNLNDTDGSGGKKLKMINTPRVSSLAKQSTSADNETLGKKTSIASVLKNIDQSHSKMPLVLPKLNPKDISPDHSPVISRVAPKKEPPKMVPKMATKAIPKMSANWGLAMDLNSPIYSSDKHQKSKQSIDNVVDEAGEEIDDDMSLMN